MDSYQQPLVSCSIYTTIIRQKKKDFGEIEKKTFATHHYTYIHQTTSNVPHTHAHTHKLTQTITYTTTHNST